MSILRRLSNWIDPTRIPIVKGPIAGVTAWGFDRVSVGIETAHSTPDLLFGVPPERWASIASMLAACVALVSLFSTLPKAFRASCWYVAQARKSIVCFAGRVRRAWAWIRERLG